MTGVATEGGDIAPIVDIRRPETARRRPPFVHKLMFNAERLASVPVGMTEEFTSLSKWILIPRRCCSEPSEM